MILEVILSIIASIELLILIQFIRDNKSKNYLIRMLRETNNQLSKELEKRKG